MIHISRALLPALLFACLSAQTNWTQSYPGPPSPPGRGPFGRHPIGKADDENQQSNQPAPANTAQIERERYAELKKETAELAQLANELKLEMAESGEHTLSLELAKKADQVARLSKRIRDRIKRGY